MLSVAIIYFSQTGITRAMAGAIQTTLENTRHVNVINHAIKEGEIINGRFINPALMAKLAGCDTVIFGSPTYMGGAAAQFKAFADATSEL